MKRTRHTPEQVINELRVADAMLSSGRSMAQVLQHLGLSAQTFDRLRNQYGGVKSGGEAAKGTRAPGRPAQVSGRGEGA